MSRFRGGLALPLRRAAAVLALCVLVVRPAVAGLIFDWLPDAPGTESGRIEFDNSVVLGDSANAGQVVDFSFAAPLGVSWSLADLTSLGKGGSTVTAQGLVGLISLSRTNTLTSGNRDSFDLSFSSSTSTANNPVPMTWSAFTGLDCPPTKGAACASESAASGSGTWVLDPSSVLVPEPTAMILVVSALGTVLVLRRSRRRELG